MSVNRTRISNVKLAVALLLGIAGVGLGPVAHIMFNSRVDGNRDLPAHMSMRGAYVNSGSRDAGPDRPIGEFSRQEHGRFDSISSILRSQAGLHGPSAAGPAAPRPPRGLYMYGGVGCGKTMLMDLLVEAAPREFQVRRAHFHDFMLDIHGRLRGVTGEADPLRHVADDVASGIKVLALDELFVTDVADAMILHRLFGRLWDDGLVLVATSNRAPQSLYEGGLQRQLFLPFIDRLQEACVVHDMASAVDYRRLARHAAGVYFLAPDRGDALHAAFLEAGEISGNGGGRGGVGQPGPATVDVAMGRTLVVPQALGNAALFSFQELCDKPLAAADYIALASAFNTVALTGVPRFGAANRAAAYRFVTLIDVLYEHRVRVLIAADGAPFELFENVLSQAEAERAAGTTAGHLLRAGSSGTMQIAQHGFSSSSVGSSNDVEPVVDDQLAFSKDRTVSRLTEMQSIEYLLAHAHAHAPGAVLALQEMAERERAARAGVHA